MVVVGLSREVRVLDRGTLRQTDQQFSNSGALSRWDIRQRHSKGMVVGKHVMVAKQSQNQQEPQASSTGTQGRSRLISRSAAASATWQPTFFYVTSPVFSVTYSAPITITILGSLNFVYSRHNFCEYVFSSFFCHTKSDRKSSDKHFSPLPGLSAQQLPDQLFRVVMS